ncbi:MAG TPA: ABC transporter substrate-binding protein [Alphaproteobacteria bacterium]|nr:ABC transporter substrate-binding protein [Alphaproteobacteria bacterium]
MRRRFSKRRPGAGFAFVLALAFAALLPPPPARAEAIRIGVLKLASSGPIFIAAEKGYFKDEGLDAKLVYFQAAQPVAVAVVSGDVDFGVTAFTAGFFNLAGKGGLTVIGAQSREEPGYHLIAYVAANKAYDAGFRSLDQFPGKKIAITQTGSSFHYSLGLLAEKLRFSLASVQLAALQSMSNMASALEGNQVDGALLPASVAIPLVQKGKVHLLGWVGNETPWQVGALFTSPREIAAHRAVVEKFVRAYQKGAREFYDQLLAKDASGKVVGGPRRAATLALIAKYVNETPAQVALGIPYIDPQGRLLVGDVYHQVAWYQAQGLLDKSVSAKSFLDLSFIKGQQDAAQ